MIIHLVDGTYELFRHFYGFRRSKLPDQPLGAVAGVLGTIMQMLDEGATHIGVATDHIVESFRNELWPGYKTGEESIRHCGRSFIPSKSFCCRWECDLADGRAGSDDALASAAHLASKDERVEKVCIWTPDKDLAQCVVANRVVQVDRRSGEIRARRGLGQVRRCSAIHPGFSALVGDSSTATLGCRASVPRRRPV
jgi:5'-3' exonuclease